jgi:glycerophosphoryl diester phosphodiesterase
MEKEGNNIVLILSHRGYWKTEPEKNSLLAFERSFASGFGTETDIRDRGGELVISHDMANERSVKAKDFFRLCGRFDNCLPLALNVKADGLQDELMLLLEKFDVKNYFVFDMSVPDALIYLRQKFNVYTRQSEHESDPPFYAEAKGVWLDSFYGGWLDEKTLNGHLKNGKKVCIVSPELHGRKHLNFWGALKVLGAAESKNIMLCTDHPVSAREFFYGK